MSILPILGTVSRLVVLPVESDMRDEGQGDRVSYLRLVSMGTSTMTCTTVAIIRRGFSALLNVF
jgi:hypothetical protein